MEAAEKIKGTEQEAALLFISVQNEGRNSSILTRRTR